MLQLVPGNAPLVIQQALRFAQRQFDELEYAEFITAMQELMDELYSAGQNRRCP